MKSCLQLLMLALLIFTNDIKFLKLDFLYNKNIKKNIGVKMREKFFFINEHIYNIYIYIG